MIYILLILVLYFGLVCMYNSKTTIRKCYSFSCKKNIGGRCFLKEIDVYDNGVLGVCLWHTSDMLERVLESMKKGAEIGKKEGEIELLDKLIKSSEDVKAIKDSKEFEKWLERHGIN